MLSNGPRRAAFKLTYAPWDAGAAGQVQETKQFTVDCGTNFDTVAEQLRFRRDEAIVGIGITEQPGGRGFPAAVSHARRTGTAG